MQGGKVATDFAQAEVLHPRLTPAPFFDAGNEGRDIAPVRTLGVRRCAHLVAQVDAKVLESGAHLHSLRATAKARQKAAQASVRLLV